MTSRVDSITYKPGWEFRLENRSLYVKAKVIDSWGPHGETTVEFETAIPVNCTDAEFFKLAKHLVHNAEMHELSEWFKVDGARWPNHNHMF